jgi:hypothetical protein
MANSEQFSIDVIGDNTDKPWKGVFKTKLRLSHKDYLKQDEIRRGLLGEKPETASPRAQNTADLFSFVLIHLIETPQWWKMNGDGLELEDDNVIGDIYGKIVELKVADQKKLKAKAEADKVEIAKSADAEKP